MSAKRVAYDGITFDSIAECGRYIELKDLESKGKIADVECHPSWKLLAFGFESECPREIGKYTADFRYLNIERGEIVVEDIKGQVPKTVTLRNGRKKRVSGGKGWTAFKLRCAILKANYGIEVQVVEGEPYTKLAKTVLRL